MNSRARKDRHARDIVLVRRVLSLVESSPACADDDEATLFDDGRWEIRLLNVGIALHGGKKIRITIEELT
jgi:hypothetical protein